MSGKGSLTYRTSTGYLAPGMTCNIVSMSMGTHAAGHLQYVSVINLVCFGAR